MRALNKINRVIWLSCFLCLVACPRVLRGQEPGWEVNPASYSNSMNIVGFLWLDKVESTDTDDQVAAFINGELRGVAQPQYVEAIDRHALFLSVFSNNASGNISFKAYDASEDAIIDLVNTADFTPNGLIGGFDASFVWSDLNLNSGAVITSFELPVQFGNTVFDGDTVRIDASLELDETLQGLVASFSASQNALITVGETDQQSGTTTNDFTSVVSYRVQSEDLLTVNDYHVKVTQVNRAPATLEIDNTVIAENQNPETFIGILSTEDEDPDDAHDYSLVGGEGDADNALFSLEENALLTASSLNFEEAGTRSIRVRATDEFGKWVEKQMTIIVSDRNDLPSEISLSLSDVDENAAEQTEVAVLSATDQDQGDSFTYALVAGAADDDNGGFTITANRLLTATAFDHEAKAVLKIRLMVTDIAGGSFEKAVQINVNDLNDAPVYSEAIEDVNMAAGDVETLMLPAGAFTDEDEGAVLTYSASQPNGDALPGWIVFNTNTNTFLFGPSPDHVGEYEVKLRATDEVGAFAEGTFTLIVNVVSGFEDLPEISDQVLTYPNPAVTYFMLDPGPLNKAQLQLNLTDRSGKPIPVSVETGNGEWKVNLSELPAGMFILFLTDGEKIARKKILKNF